MTTVAMDKPSVTFSQSYKSPSYSPLDRQLFGLAAALKSDKRQESWTHDIQLPKNRTKFQPFYRKLRSFSRLSKGWDGYDAEIPNLLAIAKARVILEKLEELKFVPTDVCPSVEGGASIYFIKDNKYADFEFFNSGDVLAGISNRVEEPIVLKINSGNVETSIEKMRQFLND